MTIISIIWILGLMMAVTLLGGVLCGLVGLLIAMLVWIKEKIKSGLRRKK